MSIKNKFIFLCALFFMNLALTPTMLAQDGQFDVKAVADCSELDLGKYYVEIYLKAHSSASTFRLAEQNYRFSFSDRDAIENPVPDASGGLSGLVTDSTGEDSFFDNITTTGSSDTVVSFNFEMVFGPGYFIPAVDWTYVGRVKFDVLDPCLPVDIMIHDHAPENFPPTVIVEKNDPDYYPVEEGDYFFENDANCPTGPTGQYKVKAVADCSEWDQGTYYVDMYLQSTDPSTTFRVSEQNYRFSFTRDAIGNPVPDMHPTLIGLEGLVEDPTGEMSLYNTQTTTGSLDTIVSFNLVLEGGPGYYVSDSDWVFAGRVKFDVLDECIGVDIKIHDHAPENFPPTFIGEKYCDALYEADEGEYLFDNDMSCPMDTNGQTGQYKVKAVADCSEWDQGFYYVDMFLQSTDASTTFRVSDQNYRLSFTRDAIGNPVPDMHPTLIGLEGVVEDNTGEFSFYGTQTTTGSIDTIVSFNLVLDGGPGSYVSDTDWLFAGRVKFDVLDPCIGVDIKIHDHAPENFPPTFIGEKYCDALYEADEGEYIFENDMACPLDTNGPNGQFNVMAVGDCSEVGIGKYYAELYLQATEAETAFRVSEQNYRISFTPNSIIPVATDQTNGLDGLITDPTGEESFYGPATITGSLGNILSYNIELVGGAGHYIPSDVWTYIGRVEFDVLDSSIPVELEIHHHSPEYFPPTFIGEKYCDALYEAEQGMYIEEDCVADDCVVENANDAETNWGIWNDGGDDAFRKINVDYANSGIRSFLLRDNTSSSVITTDDMDLSTVTYLSVDFNFITTKFNNPNHDFWLQVSNDGGSSFSTVEEWDYSVDFVNNVRAFVNVEVQGPFSANTQLRFRCDAANNGDKVFIDDIVINSCGTTIPTCSDGIQNGDETGVDCGGTDCAPCGPCTELIASDGESGWDVWIDGGLDATLSNDPAFSNSGDYSYRLKKNTNSSVITTGDMDLSSYAFLQVDFNYITTGFNISDHDFWLQISDDGGATFTTVEDWAYSVDFNNNVREFVNIIVNGPFTATTQFRFRCDAAGNNDRVYIDDIFVFGCDPINAISNDDETAESFTSRSNLESPAMNSIQVTPNPVYSDLLVEMNLIETSHAQLIITDFSGQKVLEQTLVNHEGRQASSIDVSTYVPGIYFATLLTNGEAKTQKFIVIK